MTRAFYPASRAHHAFAMAIDFSMRFKMRNGFWSLEGLAAIDRTSSYQIELAEASLHLLEPQDGDGVEFDRWHWERQRDPDVRDVPTQSHFGKVRVAGAWKSVTSLGIGWDEVKPDEPFSLPVKIIQRKGIAFHWPDFEPDRATQPCCRAATVRGS